MSKLDGIKEERDVTRKEKWDGISRISNNTYRENWNDIFGKKKKKENKEPKNRLEQMAMLTHDPIVD